MDRLAKEYGRPNFPNSSALGDVFEPKSINDAKHRTALIEWLNSTLPNLNLPVNSSDEELRNFLADGTILCRLLDKLRPGSVTEARSENVKKFLAAMDDMHLPRFNISELEKGSMKIVLECLLTLKAHFMQNVPGGSPTGASVSDAMKWNHLVEHCGSGDGSPGGELSPRTYADIVAGDGRKLSPKFQRTLRSPVMAEHSGAVMHHAGQKFHEVFQMNQGGYADIPAAKISELLKSNSLDNAPTQSLLSMVNGILDESVNRKNGEIPHRVACLLRKVVQEIERRLSTQAEHLRTQNNIFRTREEKYQSRIRVLEALTSGISKEPEVAMNQLDQMKVAMNQFDQMKIEKPKLDEDKRLEDLGKKAENQDMERLMKENAEKLLKENVERLMKENAERERLMKENVERLMKENERLMKENAERLTNDNVERLTKENERLRKENAGRLTNENVEKMTKENLERLTNEKEYKSNEIANLKQELEKARKIHEERCLEIETAAKGAQLELEVKLKEVENHLNKSKTKVKELEANSESQSQWWNKKEHLYQIFTEFQLGALRELRFASQSVKQEISKTQKSYSEDFDRLGAKIKALQDAEESYRGVLAENRKLHNELQELRGNIRVYCRIRPFLPGQTEKQSIVDYIGENGELIVANPSKQGKEGRKSFKFNKVYGPRATQAEVYVDTQPLIQSVLDGYNVCIFAYGQTGSGKTYTMSGPDKGSEVDWGVNYRALNDLFRITQSRQSTFTYEVGVQMVEIYNEQVRDLLSTDSTQKKLGISSASQNSGLAVPEASMVPVNAPSDVLGIMETGFKNRARGVTAMNERSSRSHSVVTIHVRGSDLKTGACLRGSLHLVDLAGSERIDRSEVTGDRLKEAQHINKSLSALGDVIFSLAQKSPHVPYRNSKLTQVLQSSLGGQAKTLMFVQLNPEAASFSETLSTLKFAERVSGVELGAAKSSKEGSNVKELMEQVASLKDTIAKKDEEIERLQLLKDQKNAHPSSINGEKRSLRYGSSSPTQRIKMAGAAEKATLVHENHSKTSDKTDHFKQRKESLRQSNHAEDPDASPESSLHTKSSDNTDKPKSTVKLPRVLSKVTRDPSKVTPGMNKSSSGGNLLGKTSKRWS